MAAVGMKLKNIKEKLCCHLVVASGTRPSRAVAVKSLVSVVGATPEPSKGHRNAVKPKKKGSIEPSWLVDLAGSEQSHCSTLKGPVELAQASISDASGRLPGEVFWGFSFGKRPQGRGRRESISWPGDTSEFPWKNWRKWLGTGKEFGTVTWSDKAKDQE